MRKLNAAALALSIVLAPYGAGALEAVTVTPLTAKSETAAGQPIALPQQDVRVLVSVYDIAPGAKLPVHKHPFARYALVESGTLEVTNVETGEASVYRKGDFVVEMIDLWHRAENIGEDPVRLIVIDQIEGDAQNTLLQAR
jgi:quercetin dioxygenase-like cupin family protein